MECHADPHQRGQGGMVVRTGRPYERKGESMTDEGTLSILMRENTYKVRYASNNPHSMDRQPYKCTDEEKLGEFLKQLEIDAWYIKQAFAELWKGGFVALPIVLSTEQIQEYFLQLHREGSVMTA
jgi:hypothetical protein